MKKLLLCLSAVSILLSPSCKKGSSSKTTCTSTLYGFTTPLATMYDTVSACSAGIINESTAAIATSGSFASAVYSNTGAYNTSDNSFYALKIQMGGSLSGGPLYKVSGGTVTSLTSSVTGHYLGLAYNRATSKLDCIFNNSLAEITIAGSSFSANALATTLHPIYCDGVSVDNTTGDIYVVTGDTSTYYIEKYHPGAAATSIVASGTGAWFILGMRFNKNDNMLYAIRENYPASGYDFIKIDPSAGTVSSLSPISFVVNPEFYSATIDPCSSRYVLSSLTGSFFTGHVLAQFSMSGTLMQLDTTATLYMGLDVNY